MDMKRHHPDGHHHETPTVATDAGQRHPRFVGDATTTTTTMRSVCADEMMVAIVQGEIAVPHREDESTMMTITPTVHITDDGLLHTMITTIVDVQAVMRGVIATVAAERRGHDGMTGEVEIRIGKSKPVPCSWRTACRSSRRKAQSS